MTMYLVRNLSPQDRDIMLAEGIEVDLFDASTNSYLIPKSQLTDALNSIGCTGNHFQPTEYDDIQEVILRRLPTSPVVNRASGTASSPRVVNHEERENYIREVLERFQHLAAGSIAQLEDMFARIPKALESLTLATRRELVHNDVLSKDDLKTTFASLSEIEKVEKVEFRGCHVLVTTDVLYATDPKTGDDHELGKFLITVNLEGKNEVVRWINLTRRIEAVESNMSSPRIYAKGTAYTTDMQEIFATLVASFELAPVVEMAIEFVQTCEMGNPFDKAIACWPMVPRRKAA